ncbi:MAG TPA: AAA family ATPase [Flavisolibacter sp.]|nr:AAA family ATPase [Flavisolibacter sp.]
MKKGLVLGKFLPVHKGHLGLIHFALKRCDHLTVLLCHHTGEPIAGSQRMQWLIDIFFSHPNVTLVAVEYNPADLTDTSEADEKHAKAWAKKIGALLPSVNVFFSSEIYGDVFAAALGAQHILFDNKRTIVPVSASAIRQKPFMYWDYLPTNVQPCFVKKVALLGSESTGKSTLAEALAARYNTCFVPEAAREVMGHTNDCTEETLFQVATLHAQKIVSTAKQANKLLFCDTDLNITKSYSRFLFKKELVVPSWIEETNRCDLYLFLATDCPYVQDGTRLSAPKREDLSKSHLEQLRRSFVSVISISGDWQNRFVQACKAVDKLIAEL